MRFLLHLRRCLFVFNACVLAICLSALLPCLGSHSASASSVQEDIFSDSTSYLVVTPNQLNTTNCHTVNPQAWTCVVTLYGENINNAIAWSASSPISSITFTPSKGYLAKVASLVQITISHIPCVSTFLLFSGQAYGSGVVPTTATWNCTPKPTPAPTSQPVPSPRVSPTHEITTPTSAPLATAIPRSAPTVILSVTSRASSSSQGDSPVKASGNSSGGAFLLVSALLLLGVVSCVEVVLIAILIRWKISKAR